MRTFSSLGFATVGAFYFNDAVDDLADALTGLHRSASFLEAGIWFVILAAIAGFAFFFALRIGGATWAIVLPCGLLSALAALLAVVLQDSTLPTVAMSSLVL